MTRKNPMIFGKKHSVISGQDFPLDIVYVEVSWNRATPSHHPFLDGIFPYKPSILGYPPFMETPIYGKSPFFMGKSTIDGRFP